MGIFPRRTDRRVFVSWVRYTSRSLSFATGMDAENWFIVPGARLGVLKYVPRFFVTFLRLCARRPASVFVMSPPYFAGLTVYLYCCLFRARYVLDAHTGAFDDPKWTRMMRLHRFLVQRAVFTIVTNNELALRVRDLGGKPIVLSDIPFSLPEAGYRVPAGQFNIVLVSTYASDEPIREVFEAVRGMEGAHVFVTGDSRRAPAELVAAKPDNVTLTGFLSENDYAGLLQSVDCFMVLTTRDFTMQRGGSEAITAGKPLITSNWPILREIFTSGTIHVDNSADAIRSAIQRVRDNQAYLTEGIVTLRRARKERFDAVREIIEGELSQQ